MITRIVGLVLVSLFAASSLAEEPPLRLVQTIPLDGVEGRIDHMAIDSEGKRLYVAALGNNTVEVIDLTAGKRIDSVHGVKKPTGIRVLPGSRNVMVASGDDGKVRVFSPELKLLGTVDGLDDADNVRLDPEGKLAYVGYGDGAIAVIDPVAIKKVADVKLDGHPEAFQLETKGTRIFVNVPSAKHVAVIDRAKGSVVATWPVREAASNFPMALDEANHRLFIGCRQPAKVLVLDTETANSVASIPCCGDTDDLFYNPATKQLLVSGGEGAVTTIQDDGGDRYRFVSNTPTGEGARTSLLSKESGLLYVAVPQRRGQKPELRIYQTR